MQKIIFHQQSGHKSSLYERRLVYYDAPKSRPADESASEHKSAFEQSLQKLDPEVKQSLVKKLTAVTERDTFNRGNYKKPFYTRIIQEVLVALGYNLEYIDSKGRNRAGTEAIDGLYGKNTKQAVAALQQDLNSTRHQGGKTLSVDGFFGDGTSSALCELLRNQVNADKNSIDKRKLRLKVLLDGERKPGQDFLQYVEGIQKMHGADVATDVQKLWNKGFDLRIAPEDLVFYSHDESDIQGHVFMKKGNDMFFSVSRNILETFVKNRLLQRFGDAKNLFISPRENSGEIIPITKTEVPEIYLEKQGEGRLFDQAGFIATPDINGLYRFSDGEHANTFYVFSNGRLIDGGAYPGDYDPDKHYP